MTGKQKKVLGRGCIGITALELGENLKYGNPPLDNSYSSFEQAKKEADKLEEDMKNNPGKYPPNARVIIYSVRFWSADKNGYLPDNEGKVNMSSYRGEARMPDTNEEGSGGYMNFDYGLYKKTTNTWFHANHAQPGMKVHESSLEYYSKPKEAFNRQVFVFAITTVPLK